MRQQGGLSEIIAAVILVGIVLALLISSVIPMAVSTENTIDKSKQKIVNLSNRMD